MPRPSVSILLRITGVDTRTRWRTLVRAGHVTGSIGRVSPLRTTSAPGAFMPAETEHAGTAAAVRPEWIHPAFRAA
jgi:hypothetical protein